MFLKPNSFLIFIKYNQNIIPLPPQYISEKKNGYKIGSEFGIFSVFKINSDFDLIFSENFGTRIFEIRIRNIRSNVEKYLIRFDGNQNFLSDFHPCILYLNNEIIF